MSCPKTPHQALGPEDFLLCFLLKVWELAVFTFKPVIYLELFFVSNLRLRLSFMCLPRGIQFGRHHWWKDYLPPTELLLLLCKTSVGRGSVCLFVDPLCCFIGLSVSPPVSHSLECCRYRESNSAKTDSFHFVFSFYKIILSILLPLPFRIFKKKFVYFCKNSCWVLIGIALKPLDRLFLTLHHCVGCGRKPWLE